MFLNLLLFFMLCKGTSYDPKFYHREEFILITVDGYIENRGKKKRVILNFQKYDNGDFLIRAVDYVSKLHETSIQGFYYMEGSSKSGISYETRLLHDRINNAIFAMIDGEYSIMNKKRGMELVSNVLILVRDKYNSLKVSTACLDSSALFRKREIRPLPDEISQLVADFFDNNTIDLATLKGSNDYVLEVFFSMRTYNFPKLRALRTLLEYCRIEIFLHNYFLSSDKVKEFKLKALKDKFFDRVSKVKNMFFSGKEINLVDLKGDKNNAMEMMNDKALYEFVMLFEDFYLKVHEQNLFISIETLNYIGNFCELFFKLMKTKALDSFKELGELIRENFDIIHEINQS